MNEIELLKSIDSCLKKEALLELKQHSDILPRMNSGGSSNSGN